MHIIAFLSSIFLKDKFVLKKMKVEKAKASKIATILNKKAIPKRNPA